ncbi:MAG: alkaline phosphatase family protein [Rubrobacteraceae bacterium]
MRFSRRKFLAGAASLAVLGVLPAAAFAGGRRPKHVILVDWDGFDPDYLGRVPTPNLDSLASRGSLSTIRGTYHTISNPSRASMSTGAYPEVHDNAAYIYDPSTNRAQGQSRFLAAETIAETLAAEGKTLASVQWYMVQDHGATYGDPEHLYVQPGGSFDNRVDAAIEILNQRPVDSGGQMVTVPKIPDFMAVYSSDLDGAGHENGAESPVVDATLAESDRQLGRLIQATKDVGIYGEVAWMLTSDHGMTSWDRTLMPQVLATITAAGYVPEIVTPGRSPAPETEVIIVPNGVRIGDFTLRGKAATPEAKQELRAALEGMAEIQRVFDDSDLDALRASEKLGDLVAEAKPPWGFVLSEPEPGQERGSHSSLSEIELPLLLAGAGVRRGVPPKDADLTDVAPTIAHLLGVRPPADAQGRALTEALGAPGPRD